MSQQETLNIVQQVLRGMLVSLAVTQRADLGLCASALQAFVADGGLDPMAKVMLLDLADGMDTLAKMTTKAQ